VPEPIGRAVAAAASREGLAAGLSTALARLGAVPAPGGLTILPRGAAESVGTWQIGGEDWRAEHVTVARAESRLAAAEQCEVMRVGPVAGASSPAPPGREREIATALLGLRLGLLWRMLRVAGEYLSSRHSGGSPLTGRQLVQGSIADVTRVVHAGAEYLGADPPTGATALGGIHARAAGASWEVTTMFGGGGYLLTHPVRCLYAAGLVEESWLGGRAGARGGQ
jgi:hypothetical protein